MKIEEMSQFLINNGNDVSKIIDTFSREKRVSLFRNIINLNNPFFRKRYLRYILTEEEIHDYIMNLIEQNDVSVYNFSDIMSSLFGYINNPKLKDEIIIRYLKDSSRYKIDDIGYAISEITDDNLKEKYLNEYYDELSRDKGVPRYRDIIIGSFKDERLVLKYFNELDDESKLTVVTQCKNVETTRDLFFKLDPKSKKEAFIDLFDGSSKYINISRGKEAAAKMSILVDLMNSLNSKEFRELIKGYDFQLPGYYEETDSMIHSIAVKSALNYDHLKYLCKNISMDILKELYNQNIRDLISLKDEEFYKLMSLFSKENITLNESSLNNILYAFGAITFPIAHSLFMTAFSRLRNALEEGNEKEANGIYNSIYNSQYDYIGSHGYSKKSFFRAIKNKDEKAIRILNEACNRRIDYEREMYVKSYSDDYKSSHLGNTYEANSAVEAMIREFPFIRIYEYAEAIPELSTSEIELFENKNLFEKIYNFKKDHESVSLTDEEKKQMHAFNRIMLKIYSLNKHDPYLRSVYLNNAVKSIKEIPGIDLDFIMDTLRSLDIKSMKEKGIINEDYLSRINELFKKYKFLAFNRVFDNCQLSSDTYCTGETISDIILNYDEIMNSISKVGARVSMGLILDMAYNLSNVSNVYRHLLGEENFEYISINPQENKAYAKREDRMNETINNLKTSFSRKYVAVPPIDKVYESRKGRKIRAVLGNFTDPINLSLGERTSSCMRSYGVGEELYNFCLSKVNGFHIIFYNPDTNEFISRVSGFRNGNSVFLNQLRLNTLKGYTNYDLISVCEQVSKTIIDSTTSSEYPIKNVFISDAEAMDYSNKTCFNINVPNIEEGFKHFYFDLVPEHCIVLSTTSKNRPYEEVILGKEAVELYDTLRERIVYEENSNKRVLHLEALDQLLSGKDPKSIKLNNENYKFTYSGEDWYIALTEDGRLIRKILKNSKNKEAAQKETNEVLMLINSSIDKILEEDPKARH